MNAKGLTARDVFRLLGSEPTLGVLLALDRGPATVAETAERTRMRWLAAYKVLRSLEKAGLAETVGRARAASRVGGGGRGEVLRWRIVRPAMEAAFDLLADLADTRKSMRDLGM